MNPTSNAPFAGLLLVTALLLTGCDIPGLDGDKKTAAAEADGKAIGSACRHALRAIEDCYTQNPDAIKAAVFAGWKEMDEYMRENKLEGIRPTGAPAVVEEAEAVPAKPEKTEPKAKAKGGH